MLQQTFYPALADEDLSQSDHQQQAVADLTQMESPGIFAQIDRLEEAILNSPRVPLTGKTMVEEEDLLDRLDAIRLSLPETLQTAREVLEYKHQIIKEAQQQAQQLLAEANRHAYQVANELGIIDRAEAEATQIRQIAMAECEQLRQQTIAEVEQIRHQNIQDMERMRQTVIEECNNIQDGADKYADRVLSDIELDLTDVLKSIQKGRTQLNIQQKTV